MAVRTKLNLMGPIIRDMRMKRKWTQMRLAEKICALGWKIDRGSLAQMEATQKRITDCDLLFIAKALEANLADFFPTETTAEMLQGKILSRRLLANPSGDESPREIETGVKRPRKNLFSIFGRFHLWNFRGV